MKTIQPAIKIVMKIANEQRILPDAGYRLSHHVAQTPCEDGQLLFHSLTGELLLLERGEAVSSPTLRETLIKHWLLVPEDFNEKKQTDTVKSIVALLEPHSSKITHYVVFTTTDCNARCFYCFEKGQRRLSMSEQTAKDVAAYMAAHAEGETVTIRWFGGEPLFNPLPIDIVSRELEERGVAFKSYMVTNGFLFDDQNVEKAVKNWKLYNAIITLDGTEEVYNRTKAYIYPGENGYRRVMDNIEKLLQVGISVTVNLNMDRGNANDLMVLAEELAARFGKWPRFSARCALLREYKGKIHAFENDRIAFDNWQALEQRLKALGIAYKRLLPTGVMLHNCMADNDAYSVIQPSGDLGTCEHFGDSCIIGNIYSGITDQEIAASWKETRPPIPECKTCVHYPLCIPLKNCNGISPVCDELERSRATAQLQEQMRNTYEQYKVNRGENLIAEGLLED